MAERINSQRLKKSLILFFILGTCLIGLTIAFVAVHPLYGRLKDEQRRHLLHKLEIKRMIVEEYLSRARDTALQVTSRTQIRKKLAAYNRGEFSREELESYSAPKLADALSLSEDMAGITRLDEAGRAVIEVGNPIPPQFWPRPPKGERQVPIGGPLLLDGVSHIVLGANILDREGNHVGTDIVLFHTRGLKRIVDDRIELGSGGETIICCREADGLRFFFALGTDENRSAESLLALLEEQGIEARNPAGETFTAGTPGGGTHIYAYSSLAGTNWILVLKIDQGMLFRAVNLQIAYIGGAIGLFLIFGLIGMTLLLRPLTGRILVHTEELERQNVELRKLDNLKDGLLRDVSHELKTPVAKHAMQLEILKPIIEKHSLNPQERNAIRVMEDSLARQQLVIRNLLDLSRLEAGGRTFTRKPVHLNQLLEQIRADYQHAIEEYGIDFRIDVDSQTLMSDREMLWHVFSNLVNNAIKFRRQDVTPSIAVSSRLATGEVQVQIADNGVGLHEEDKEKVFSRFYQRTASSEGSGVGLSIAKMIVGELGGTIALESPGPGMGTTALVSLPTP